MYHVHITISTILCVKQNRTFRTTKVRLQVINLSLIRVKVIPVNIISITLKHYASEKVTGHFVFVSADMCVSLFALINSCKPLNNLQLKGTAQFLFV